MPPAPLAAWNKLWQFCWCSNAENAMNAANWAALTDFREGVWSVPMLTRCMLIGREVYLHLLLSIEDHQQQQQLHQPPPVKWESGPIWRSVTCRFHPFAVLYFGCVSLWFAAVHCAPLCEHFVP
jgi:hypothetical protein